MLSKGYVISRMWRTNLPRGVIADLEGRVYQTSADLEQAIRAAEVAEFGRGGLNAATIDAVLSEYNLPADSIADLREMQHDNQKALRLEIERELDRVRVRRVNRILSDTHLPPGTDVTQSRSERLRQAIDAEREAAGFDRYERIMRDAGLPAVRRPSYYQKRK